jgi:hypothetical protein
MPPLTLKILASLLQIHGPDATLASDHKGLEALLTDVTASLVDNTGAVLPTSEQRFAERPYQKVYLKDDYYYGKGNYAKYIKGKYSKAV